MEWCTFRLIIVRSQDFDIRFGIRNDVEEWYFDLKTGYTVDCHGGRSLFYTGEIKRNDVISMTVCKNKVVFYINDMSLGRAFFDMRF